MDSLHFIQGGRNGVVLNGPMGSRIRGDTLWVLDIDALRAFDARSRSKGSDAIRRSSASSSDVVTSVGSISSCEQHEEARLGDPGL